MWSTYHPDELPNIKSDLSRALVKTLGDLAVDFFSYKIKIRPNRTRLVKEALCHLGHIQFKYKVYANGLSSDLTQRGGGVFKNVEWLFDLHWYTEGTTPYTTIRLPLVVECEWQQKRRADRIVPFSGIKYDFQKLLVCNAEFRLMIFLIERKTDFADLETYFEENIKNYQHLPSGSPFLFVGFFQTQKTVHYKEIFKE